MATESVRQHSIPLEILDDLGSRFIINVPEEERKDLIRICFQLELAHWFYLDYYVSSEENKQSGNLRSCNIREFAAHMFRHIKFLRKHVEQTEKILDDWLEYKLSVPTYGAIILNEDMSQILLVQGYWSKSSWGFPKGKVNEEEPGEVCAVREVLEETGFDISAYINPDEYLENVVNDQTTRLYLIPGVPSNTEFVPKTKCEIRDVQWFPVDALPISKKETMPPNPLNIAPNNLYMVLPFIKGLKKWIRRRRWQLSQTSPTDGATPKMNRRRSRKSSNGSGSKSDSNQRSRTSSGRNQNFPDEFYPVSWSNFKVQTKDVFSVMSSTPRWIQ